jgi:hypothetical protein
MLQFLVIKLRILFKELQNFKEQHNNRDNQLSETIMVPLVVVHHNRVINNRTPLVGKEELVAGIVDEVGVFLGQNEDHLLRRKETIKEGQHHHNLLLLQHHLLLLLLKLEKQKMILSSLLMRRWISPQLVSDKLVMNKSSFISNTNEWRFLLLLPPLFLLLFMSNFLLSHQRATKIPGIPSPPYVKPSTPKTRPLQPHELLHESTDDSSSDPELTTVVVDVAVDEPVEEEHDDYETYLAKKKKISQEVPIKPPVGSRQNPHGSKNFYADTGPMTVADLKRIATERLQYRTETLSTLAPKVDYRELRKEKRHERANLLKAKRAALRERLFGPKKKVTIIKEIRIPSNGLTVKELAMRLSRTVSDTMEQLEKLGELTIGKSSVFLLLPS